MEHEISISLTADNTQFIKKKDETVRLARDTKKELDSNRIFELEMKVANFQTKVESAKKTLAEAKKAGQKDVEFEARLEINRLSRETTEAKRLLANYLNTWEEGTSRLQAKFNQVTWSIKWFWASLWWLLWSLWLTVWFASLWKEIINTAGAFEKYQVILTNSLWSQEDAKQAFIALQDIAKTTPFTLDEITQSYIKMINRGIKPTKEEIISLWDLASSQGKSFDQLIEAVLDAQTGEFERLKEFWVKAKVSWDDVTFTFKWVETTVKKTEWAIKDYILSLWNLEGISWSMSAQSRTFQGAVSNLQDARWQFAATIWSFIIPKITDLIKWLSNWLTAVTTFVKNFGASMKILALWLSATFQFIGWLFTALWATFLQTMGYLWQVIVTVWSWIIKNAKILWENIAIGFGIGISMLWNAAIWALNGALSWIENFVNTALKWVQKLIDGIKKIPWASDLIGNVSVWTVSLWRIWASFGWQSQAFKSFEAIKLPKLNIASTFKTNLNSEISDIKNTYGNAIKDVVASVKQDSWELPTWDEIIESSSWWKWAWGWWRWWKTKKEEVKDYTKEIEASRKQIKWRLDSMETKKIDNLTKAGKEAFEIINKEIDGSTKKIEDFQKWIQGIDNELSKIADSLVSRTLKIEQELSKLRWDFAWEEDEEKRAKILEEIRKLEEEYLLAKNNTDAEALETARLEAQKSETQKLLDKQALLEQEKEALQAKLDDELAIQESFKEKLQKLEETFTEKYQIELRKQEDARKQSLNNRLSAYRDMMAQMASMWWGWGAVDNSTSVTQNFTINNQSEASAIAFANKINPL